MRIACVLVPYFAALAEAQRRHSDRPILVVETDGSRKTVIDFTPGQDGLSVGMPLQEALARSGNALPVDADVPYYRTLHSRIVNALQERAPQVEATELGAAYVDLTGMEAMYGGEPRLILALENAVPREFAPRIGVGEGKFTAYVAAARAKPGQPVIVQEDAALYLASVPVEVLPVSWDMRLRLHGFGLRTLGEVARRPLGPVQAQFGPEGKLAWLLARGQDPRPLLPHQYEESIIERMAFPAPVVFREPVIVAAESLLGRAFARPERRGRAVRQAVLEARIVRTAPWTRTVVFREPYSRREQAFMPVKTVLESARLPGPVEELRVTLSGLTGETGRQESLFRDVRKREQLTDAVRQLRMQLGKQPPLYQVREVEPWSRIPERRRALVPFAP